MSLRVWLPLDGDLHNQGMSDLNLTSSATFTTSGKIGQQCLSSQIGWFTVPEMDGKKQMSFTYWVKINEGTTTNWLDSFSWYSTDGSSATRSRQEFYYYDANSGVMTTGVWYKGGSNSGLTQRQIGKWYHYAFTIDYEAGISNFYCDGVLFKTTTNIDTTHYIRSTNQFLLRESSLNCSLNDFRIYDHCLSIAEIKEISQGLILHYKLDSFQGGYGNPNLITNFDTSFLSYADGATTLFTNQMNSGTQEIISNFAGANKCLHLHSNGGNNRQYRTIGLAVGKTYTISADYYSTTRQTIAWRGELNGGNYSWSSASAGTYDTPGVWRRMSYTYSDLTSNATLYFFTHCANGTDCYIKNIKIEYGSSATTWSSSDISTTIIQDSSGYNHNGTINGSLIISSDTSRYNCSAQFDGVDDSITVPYNAICPENIFTFNLWFKKDALGSKNYETLFGGPSGFEMDTRASSATTLSLYMASTRSGKRNLVTELSLGNWYMITMIRDGTKEKYYVNGIYQSEIDAKAMPTGVYRIGAWASNTGQNYYGLISDFRIYCTALDADAIRQLYEVGAKIDNKQNFHTFELAEINSGQELLGSTYITPSYGNHTAMWTNYDTNGEITLTNNVSLGSPYIKISPEGKKYYFDADISVEANNQVYIGFQRYDAGKTSRSNDATIYVVNIKPTTALVHQHYHGIYDATSTKPNFGWFDAYTPVDTISLRILNDWSGANNRKLIIHRISLREISSLDITKINKQGQTITDNFTELDGNCHIQKNGIIESNEFIEL